MALPEDGEIWRNIDNGIAPDDAPELMTLEIAKRVVENVGSGTYFANNYALSAGVVIEDKVKSEGVAMVELDEE